MMGFRNRRADARSAFRRGSHDKRWRNVLRTSALLIFATAACSSPPPPPPSLELTIAAGADQNPGPSGQPTPVAIRVYQLAATAAFERADPFALADHDVATLGPDDLGGEEFLLAPGETRVVKSPVKQGAQFIGCIVLFRDIDHATWRTQAPLKPNGPTKLTLHTAGLVATLTGG